MNGFNPVLTPEQRARLKIQSEMVSRTNQSIYDSRGELNLGRANALSDGNVALGEYLDLSSIPFAPEPYGSDHCTHLARLVEYMTTITPQFGGLGPFEFHDTKVLYVMAMTYCTGMAQGPDGYPARSAQIADTYLRAGGGAGTYWGKQEVREEVCRLIYRHTDLDEISIDKRLQVFNDGLRFELSRLVPNTAEGYALLKTEWKPEKFHCGWSRDSANRRAHMTSRGWK